MHSKVVIGFAIISLGLSGCAAHRDVALGMKVTKESPTMQRAVYDNCMANPFHFNPESEIDAEVISSLNVPESQRQEALCQRLVAGVVSGAFGPADYDSLKKGMFTPSLLAVLRTPAAAPKIPPKQPASPKKP